MLSLDSYFFFYPRRRFCERNSWLYAKALLQNSEDMLTLARTHLLLQQRATPCQSFWYHISGTEAEYSLLLRSAVSLFLKKEIESKSINQSIAAQQSRVYMVLLLVAIVSLQMLQLKTSIQGPLILFTWWQNSYIHYNHFMTIIFLKTQYG